VRPGQVWGVRKKMFPKKKPPWAEERKKNDAT